MLTYRKAIKLLQPVDTVYSLDESGGVTAASVLEVYNGWLETSVGILDFEDHGCTWWMTRKVAMENAKNEREDVHW